MLVMLRTLSKRGPALEPLTRDPSLKDFQVIDFFPAAPMMSTHAQSKCERLRGLSAQIG